MFNLSIMCSPDKKSQELPRTHPASIEFSCYFLKNTGMKKLWFPLVVTVLVLVGCAPDTTLDTLIPRNSLAVVLVDHPGLVLPLLGQQEGEFPLKALDTGKPWAGAALPANPPGFLMALALADQPSAWSAVEAWARERGGLDAVRVGSYAVLSSPGLPPSGVLDIDRRFDLNRVRAGGDPVAVYIDVKNMMDEADFPEALRPAFGLLPWAEKNLAGIRLGFNARDGGLELRLATEWKAGSPLSEVWKGGLTPADLTPWTSLLPSSQGVGAVLSLPPQAYQLLAASMEDPALKQRWTSVVPYLGPRIALAAIPGPEGQWGWSGAVESRDPQAVRQALKTLVAGGELQRNFPAWALDTDTPLIYQDSPDGTGGVRTLVTLGTEKVQLTYGADRVVMAGGVKAAETLQAWKAAGLNPAPWSREAPAGASLVAIGSVDGLAAKGAVKILADGNWELRVWTDASGLKAWEERLPQVLLQWLSGEGGVTRWEP